MINRIFLDSNFIMKIHAEDLFAKEKQRLRYMLDTAILDIHITYDI